MEIGKLIKYHRTRQEMTQKELAHGICSVSYLSKVENNSIDPSEDIIDALAGRLNISFTMMDGNEDELKDRIKSWYSIIKLGDKRQAKQEYLELKKMCDLPINIEIKHLFAVMKFIYEITFLPIKDCEETYTQLKEIEHFYEQETLYYFLKFESLYFYYNNNLEAAIRSLKRAEIEYKKIDINDIGLYYNLSIYYRKTYQIYQSFFYAYKALREAQLALDYHFLTKTQLLLAANFLRIGEYDEAKNILLKLLKSEQIQNKETNSLIYHNLGCVYFKQYDYEKAIHYLLTAIEYQALPQKNVDTYYVLALIYNGINDTFNLTACIKKGKEIAIKFNITKYIYKFSILEAQINNETFNANFAKKLKNEIIPFFRKTGERNELMRQLKLLGDMYYQNHKYKNAAQCFSEIHNLYINTFRLESFHE